MGIQFQIISVNFEFLNICELKSCDTRKKTLFIKLWNDIPETIKCSVDLNAFKRNLKTYLFKRYFNE